MKRLLLLLCLSTACQATQLRVCADNRNVPPLSFIGGMGEMPSFSKPSANLALGVMRLSKM